MQQLLSPSRTLKEALPTEVLSALKSSYHLDLFRVDRQLVELLEQKSTILDQMRVSCFHFKRLYSTVQESEREVVCQFSNEVAGTCQ